MNLTDTLRRFIRQHASDDLSRLLLSASRYPEIDIPFAVEQIASRRQIRDKLPSWYADDRLIFPSKIAAEQCSSEWTAAYKQRLVEAGQCLCDLTGGLGIDSYFFSRKIRSVLYIERFSAYCEAARANFNVLGAANIEVRKGNSTEMLSSLPPQDVFYIDPARRGDGNRRVFALQDCEPDLPALLPSLWQKAPKVIAKLSPMADLRHTLELLPDTTAVHVLSVRNECKELLFVMERNQPVASPLIHCVHQTSRGVEESFVFTLEEEQRAMSDFAQRIGHFLYEPNASLMKAGAFKTVGRRMRMQKLHASSHLYTSDEWESSFPGRQFVVEEIIPFAGKTVKTISRALPRANLTVRNFPLSVEVLRKRLKIREGGEVYLFATTLFSGEKVLIRCHKPDRFPATSIVAPTL